MKYFITMLLVTACGGSSDFVVEAPGVRVEGKLKTDKVEKDLAKAHVQVAVDSVVKK